MKAVLISLEAWDDVWRRNQHLASQLMSQELVDELVFVEPVRRGPVGLRARHVGKGIVAVTPSTPIPKSLGGLTHVGRMISRELSTDADLIWVNDPSLGARCLTPGTPVVYDVTDDWREAGFPRRIRRRICIAEDRLARCATTIVCSPVLRKRWHERYGVDSSLVPNGIDPAAWSDVRPVSLAGHAPHVGYIGTLHEQRLDVPLVTALARHPHIGTVHLVGPNCLGAEARGQLNREPNITVHGPVPAPEVPRWTAAMDVLVSPHIVDSFTRSLDAIKAYEYAASGRPVVATPTSGFPDAPGHVLIADQGDFADRVAELLEQPTGRRPWTTGSLDDLSWAQRSRDFWTAVAAARHASTAI